MEKRRESFLICLLLIIIFSVVLKQCYLMMNQVRKIHFTSFKNHKFDGQTLTKGDFFKGRLPKYFFGQYVPLVVSNHAQVSAVFIVKTAILEHP